MNTIWTEGVCGDGAAILRDGVPVPISDVLAALNKKTELRLILSMAPSYQGGHSKTGAEVADYLGIPFPLTTANLEKKAKECGFDPYDLWPWLKEIRQAATSVQHWKAKP